MQEYGIYLNIGTLAALALAVAGGVWKIRDIEKNIRDEGSEQDTELRDHLEAQIENVQRDQQNHERNTVAGFETLRHEVGETGLAIRQKIHDVELFTRDTFVEKEHFERSIERIETSIDKLGDRLEAKIDRSVIGRRDW